jgi:hypothetical protein
MWLLGFAVSFPPVGPVLARHGSPSRVSGPFWLQWCVRGGGWNRPRVTAVPVSLVFFRQGVPVVWCLRIRGRALAGLLGWLDGLLGGCFGQHSGRSHLSASTLETIGAFGACTIVILVSVRAGSSSLLVECGWGLTAGVLVFRVVRRLTGGVPTDISQVRSMLLSPLLCWSGLDCCAGTLQ